MIRDKEQETSVIKKANDFISFKFGDVHFLDIMKFLGGATTLDSFLKAYKASETKGFFPYEWFDSPGKFDFPELPPYEAFFSKLRYFTDFISKSGYDPKSFRGVSVEDLPAVEEIVQRNIFMYDFDIQDGEYIGELARRSIGRFDKTVRLLRFNNHIIHTNHSFCLPIRNSQLNFTSNFSFRYFTKSKYFHSFGTLSF